MKDEPGNDQDQPQRADVESHDLSSDGRARSSCPSMTPIDCGHRHQVGVDQPDHGDHQQAAALQHRRRRGAKAGALQPVAGHPLQPFLDLVPSQFFHPGAEQPDTVHEERQSSQD